MKTETLINAAITICIIGLVICSVILIRSCDKPNAISPKPKAPDTVRIKNDCDICGVVETYSLNVNCYHYGDSIEE